MKQKELKLFALAVVLFVSAACAKEAEPVVTPSVTIDPSELSVIVGTPGKVEVTVVPEGASYELKSLDESVATVSSDGTVSGIASGKTSVVAVMGECTDTCKVTVIKEDEPSVSITPSELSVKVGATEKVTVVVTPSGSAYELKSLDESVATVSSDGTVSGIASGKTSVVAVMGECTDTCKVTVSDDIIYATKLKVNPAELITGVGNTTAVTLTKVPPKCNEPVVWSSDDESVATVDQLGVITGVSMGTTLVRVKSRDCEAIVNVSVGSDVYVTRVDALTRYLNNVNYVDDMEPIRVARGEVASVQIGFVALDDISAVKAEVEYFGGEGKMLIAPKLYWEREITCSRHWDGWAGGAADDEIFTDNDKYFDPLMPCDGEWNPAPMSVNGRGALWCEFAVPRDFAPGTYSGRVKLTFTIDGREIPVTKDFDVQVYKAALPEKQTMNVIQWDGGDYSEMNGGVYPDFYAWPELQTVIVRFMNDYCQTAWRLRYAAKHNMGGACAADYTTDPPTFKYDFEKRNVGWPREFELYLANCTDLRQVHGLQVSTHSKDDDERDRLIIGAYYMNPDKPDAEGRPTLDYGYSFPYSDSKQDKLIQAGFSEYFRQLEQWLRAHEIGDGRTWFDLYVQTIVDEPKDPLADDYSEIARLIKAGSPEMKITDAIETNLINPEYLDYPCPTLKFIPQCRAKGNQEQWMYTCMSPQGNYANRFIRIPLIKTRLVHWCNYYYDAPNYLHWGLMYWMGAKDDEPYGDVCGQFIGGDSYIIYPGYKKVYPSIRLCVMRDGVRDFDLLTMIGERDRSKAKEFLYRIVKGEADYETDVTAFRECRKEMLEYLSE